MTGRRTARIVQSAVRPAVGCTLGRVANARNATRHATRATNGQRIVRSAPSVAGPEEGHTHGQVANARSAEKFKMKIMIGTGAYAPNVGKNSH